MCTKLETYNKKKRGADGAFSIGACSSSPLNQSITR